MEALSEQSQVLDFASGESEQADKKAALIKAICERHGLIRDMAPADADAFCSRLRKKLEAVTCWGCGLAGHYSDQCSFQWSVKLRLA